MGNSIFVEAFEAIRAFPSRPNFNYYDSVENQFVKKLVMLQAHLTCIKEINNLPRQIDKKDKRVKFDKKHSGLFKKNQNYEKVFGYNIYLEENLGKASSKNKNRKTDKTLPEDFLEACHKKVRKTNQNVSFEKNQKGLILKLGNRKANNYCRIYKEKTSLKFEYEMKGQLLRKYHNLLISNCLKELENLMCEGFLRHFGKLLPLEESFTDWLVVKLRPLRKQKLSFATFHSHYLEEKRFNEGDEEKKFFILLQFLNYAQNLDYERGALGSTASRQVIFQVKDFLEYQKKSNNYYQLKKLIEFFDEL